ncbi:MAG: DUF5685 family protein [Gordonibacter pamelaeae]
MPTSSAATARRSRTSPRRRSRPSSPGSGRCATFRNGWGADHVRVPRRQLGRCQRSGKARYRAAYCGLCRTLGGRCGQRCRLALTYDMAFLVLLHGSLYEPEETQDQARCLLHPLSPHDFVQTRFTGYAADLTVALVYHKCLDDWHDDRNGWARAYGGPAGEGVPRGGRTPSAGMRGHRGGSGRYWTPGGGRRCGGLGRRCGRGAPARRGGQPVRPR